MREPNVVYPIEKIIASLSYLSAGLVGFIWLVVAAIFKKNVTKFLSFHIFQSIFLVMVFYMFNLLLNLLSAIPILNHISFFITGIIDMPIPIILGYSLRQTITTVLMLYLIITSLFGKLSYIPWVSDIIAQNTGNR